MLSSAEAAAVEARIAAIERATGVQVVAALVRRSDAYPELVWKAFALGAAVGAFLVVAFDVARPNWMLRYAAWSNATPILALGGASAFERRVEILADIGFDGRIDERDWRSVIEAMTPALPQASAADAFARGLDRLDALLAAKGFRGRGTRNELPDEPIDEGRR